MIEMGATTIWELWKYETGPGMNSHNHPAFGFISGWFYSDIAGIVPTWEGAGFARFDIKPHLMGDLKNARASVDTVRGRVSSSWEREGSTVRLEVTVPANSTADVWVPLAGGGPAEVFEGGKPVWRDGAFVPGVPGISAGQAAGRWIRFEAGSGHYRFESRS
jgi:alpha-L-rhamnosidase